VIEANRNDHLLYSVASFIAEAKLRCDWSHPEPWPRSVGAGLSAHQQWGEMQRGV